MYELLWALTNACWRKELWQFLFLTRDLCLASLASYLQKKINSLFQTFTIRHPKTHLWRVWPFEWHLLILTLLLLKIMLHQFHLSVVQGSGRWINQANTWLLWAVHKLCRQNINKEGSHWWLLIEKFRNLCASRTWASLVQIQPPRHYWLMWDKNHHPTSYWVSSLDHSSWVKKGWLILQISDPFL